MLGQLLLEQLVCMEGTRLQNEGSDEDSNKGHLGPLWQDTTLLLKS
jgi:hypothetical protein